MAILEKLIRMKKKKGNDIIISYPQTVGENVLVDNKAKRLSEKLTEIDGKLASPTVTGVKGSSEGSYRTGQVNLTAANVGAAASSHTHSIANVTNLQSSLDGKAGSSHTHNYAGSGSAGGAASSAVKLATSRNINGVPFDGTANITVADSTKVALSGGTMTGILTANNNTSYETSQVRNSYFTPTELTAGSSVLANGTIAFVYE